MGYSHISSIAYGFPTGREHIPEEEELGQAMISEGLFPATAGTQGVGEGDQSFVVIQASIVDVDLDEPKRNGLRIPTNIRDVEGVGNDEIGALHARCVEFGVSEEAIGWYFLDWIL